MNAIAAYQGERGAFGEEACRRFLPEWRATGRRTFADVVQAVRTGETGRGILPLENAIAGAVPGMADLIAESGLVILTRRTLPIRLHLLALPGSALEEILSVASHPVALAQCGRWTEGRRWTIEHSLNTAVAARELAGSGDRTRAAIASEAAAAIHGLAILRRDVHDHRDNHTIFGIVAKGGGGAG